MGRRTFIRAVASMLVLAAPLTTSAQTAKTVRRIGFLASGAPATRAELEQHFAPLRELGWIEGQNLVFERRYTYDRPELLRSYADELVRLRVDLILTEGTDATLAAKDATKTIPIVIRSAADPVRTGIVASLARPGGNITGFAVTGVDAEVKLVALLRELLPDVQRVGRLDSSTNLYYRAVREDLEQAYRSLGIQPIFVEVARASELENAIAEIVRRKAQALAVGGANLLHDNRVDIMRATLKHALPTIGSQVFLEAGALISLQFSLAELRRRGAAYIDRILRGANPADLPIEQPTQFELGINLKTAKALGITVPVSMLLRAHQVIQ